MAYVTQSFSVGQVLTNIDLNKLESNIFQSRKVLGEVRQSTASAIVSSGWGYLNFDSQYYIDDSGETYFENITGSEYGWYVQANKFHELIDFNALVSFKKETAVASAYVSLALENSIGQTVLSTNRVDVSTFSIGINIGFSEAIWVSISGTLIPTAVSNISSGHMRLKYYSNTASVTINNDLKSLASIKYVTRNY